MRKRVVKLKADDGDTKVRLQATVTDKTRTHKEMLHFTAQLEEVFIMALREKFYLGDIGRTKR